MKISILLLTVASGAFLGLRAHAGSGDAPAMHRHNPVIYSPAQTNPLGAYPKDIIGNIIRPDRSAYTICTKNVCTLIRNFGHDATIRREYVEHIIDKQRAKQ